MGALQKLVTSIYFQNYIKCLNCWYFLKQLPPPKKKCKCFVIVTFLLKTASTHLILHYLNFLSHMNNNIDPVCHCLFYVSEEMFTVFSVPLNQLMQWPKIWPELTLPTRLLSTNCFLAWIKEREKQHETSSAIGGELIIKNNGYSTVQNSNSTKPVDNLIIYYMQDCP